MSGMNYLGSISILDRGDGPAQAVIDRNARSLAQRMADETRDELNKVMSRVHTIYGAMDSTEDLFPTSANMEYLNDVAELEAILKDEIKKRQYQQQVTVFIVGYQDVCHQKLRLLQQVNEFFMENSKQIDEEDWFPTTPDLDVDEVSNAVEDSLTHAHELTSKLAILNREMVDYMAALAEKKASNKGKKKIEKALQQAKEELSGLSEKLLTLQTELDDREEKVANLFKQMDSKNLELQKYRTAAELGKKATEDMEELRRQLMGKEAKIITQRQQLSKMEVELTQSNHLKDRTEMKFSMSDEESQQKINILQKEIDEQRRTNEEIKADMTKLLDSQISALHESHKQEMDELKKQHQTESQKLQEDLEQHQQDLAQYQHELITLQLEKGDTETPSEVARIVDLDSEPSQLTSRQSSQQESRPSTKDTKVSGKPGTGRTSGKGSRSPTRTSRDSKPTSRASGARTDKEDVFFDDGGDDEELMDYDEDGKEYAEIAIQDEGGNPATALVDEKARTPNTRHSKRAVSTLAPVLESDFDNAFDLFDNEAWSAVPGDQMSSRFAQYRRLSTHQLLELEEQLQLTNAKTKRKVNTLKAQFQEHKGKWEAERRILIEQVDQSLRLQTDAEKEADAAMTQLEDFITEQERLEQEEEVKRSEVLHSSASLTPQDGLTPLQGSVVASPTPGGQQVILTPESEQELQRLMQQTDDAKSARQGLPSSTSTRTSSSGSFQVGTLLDVTQPPKQKQPSPDVASTPGAVTIPSSPTKEGATAPSSRKSSDPRPNGEVQVVQAPDAVSTQVLNEVGLAIDPESGHVALLKSPEEKMETAQSTIVQALATAECVILPTVGVEVDNANNVSQSGEKQVLPSSGQPMPPSMSKPQSAGLVGQGDVKKNPVILIMPDDKGKPGDQASSVQALIPGGTDLGKSSDLDIEIIPQQKAKSPGMVPQSTPGLPVVPSREGSFLDKPGSTHIPAQRPDTQSADMESAVTSTPGSKPPTALDVLGLMNPKQPTPQLTPGQTPAPSREPTGIPPTNVPDKATDKIQTTTLGPGGQDSTVVTQPKLADVEATPALAANQQPFKEISELSIREEEDTPTVALDGIALDLATPREGSEVQELNARLGTCSSAPPTVGTDKEAAKVSVEEVPRSKTAAVLSPVVEGVTLQLSAVEKALSASDTPLALKITNKATGEVEIRDIIQGTVAHVAGQEQDAGTATTFMAPNGQILVTAPTEISIASSQGLVPIEVHGDTEAASRVNSASAFGQESRSSTAPVLKMHRSPIGSPTKLVSFSGDPMPSPRSSRLRRSKTAELAIVLESNLGPSQESAIEMVKKMMTDEENLKPKQVKALNSMRAAVKAVEARDALSDEEIARTLTVLALASQMSHEAFQLGVRPDSIFRSFSQMNPKSLSQMVPPRPKSSPGRQAPSTGFEGRELTKDIITRETTLASVQEVDNESMEGVEKQEAEVDLSQLKELPLLDIVDTLPAEGTKPASGILLPSEATIGSSYQDPLETPFTELLEDDPIKLLKEREKTQSQGELMDDGSNMERAQTHISEREATQAASETHTESVQYADANVQQSFSTASKQATDLASKSGTDGLSKQATGSMSKQPTDVSYVGTQKSMIRKSVSSLEGMKIEGTTEEEIRSSSAQSRASLRNAYKVRLEETKWAAEDRRSKSPHISLPTQLTVDDELILNDEDDDGDETEEIGALPDDLKEDFLAYKDPSMYEVGTSPPPGLPSRDPTDANSKHDGFKKSFKGVPSRDSGDPSKDPPQPTVQKIIKKGISLLKHPLLREFLKTYDGVVSFKESMSKMFLDKDMMSAHQMTSDLEMMTFDTNQKAMPQVEDLTKNVCHVLQEISTLISSILIYDREPPVSSLLLMSREATQKSFVPPAETISEQPVAPPTTREVVHSSASSARSSQKSGRVSVSSDKMHIKELQEQYNELKNQLDQDSKVHQDQLQRNTVVMMEMQDTINDLHRELSALGKSTKRSKSITSASGTGMAQKSPSPETSVMFTRLDSERNAKIMKKAVVEEKLHQERYKEAVAKMDEYVSLPAQRLAHLVKKYVHHRRMKEIEEKVKNSSSVDEEVFDVLDKMENLQNQRARQWAASMDEMGIERLRLANLLMNTLENIEQESGIFLIKPMYSYRGRHIKPGTQGKLSRPVRSQHRNVTPTNDAASSFIPAPTPASNYRLVRHERHFLQQLQQQQQQSSNLAEMRPAEVKVNKDDGNEVKVMGSGMTFSAGSPRLTWNMQASQPWVNREDPNAFNTPRILELDINRMLIGQNNISSKLPFPPTEDRLVNASQNSLRSYVTVNRPTAVFGAEKAERRPGSGREVTSASLSSSRHMTVSDTDKDIPATLPTASPLPPITPVPGEEEEEEELQGEGRGGTEMTEEDIRPPSVAFSNDNEEEEEREEAEEEDNEGEDQTEGEAVAKEPPQSPPGSSLYQSTLRNEDSESVIKPTRASSRLTLSEDEN